MMGEMEILCPFSHFPGELGEKREDGDRENK